MFYNVGLRENSWECPPCCSRIVEIPVFIPVCFSFVRGKLAMRTMFTFRRLLHPGSRFVSEIGLERK